MLVTIVISVSRDNPRVWVLLRPIGMKFVGEIVGKSRCTTEIVAVEVDPAICKIKGGHASTIVLDATTRSNETIGARGPGR